MTLPRKRASPRRKTHPIRPPGESAAPVPVYEPPERWDPAYRAAVDESQRRAHGACEARLDGCRGHGVQPHHVWPVSEGGPVVVPAAWLRWLCAQCHSDVHDVKSRDFAEALGLIVPRARLRV